DGPRLVSKVVNGECVSKPRDEYSVLDRKKLQMNAKAIHMIFCVLSPNEYNKVTYEGTNQVKESKISMLVHEYEMFKMHDDETITSMFTRFANITNTLKSLGKSYSNIEMMRKDLRSLPIAWRPKVTAI
ncbi:UBN2 domain-containing protein, partial [Cephalotus follicularis]